MEALAKGLHFYPGSHEESIFMRYTERRASIEYLKILTLVNAIITTGNTIVAAINKSDQTPTSDKLRQSFDALQDLLMPHEAENREAKAREAKLLLQEEIDKGKITFRPMKKPGGRDFRKRKSKRSI
jgi:hypothetical protein